MIDGWGVKVKCLVVMTSFGTTVQPSSFDAFSRTCFYCRERTVWFVGGKHRNSSQQTFLNSKGSTPVYLLMCRQRRFWWTLFKSCWSLRRIVALESCPHFKMCCELVAWNLNLHQIVGFRFIFLAKCTAREFSVGWQRAQKAQIRDPLHQGWGTCGPREHLIMAPVTIFVTQFRVQDRVKTKLHDKAGT